MFKKFTILLIFILLTISGLYAQINNWNSKSAIPNASNNVTVLGQTLEDGYYTGEVRNIISRTYYLIEVVDTNVYIESYVDCKGLVFTNPYFTNDTMVFIEPKTEVFTIIKQGDSCILKSTTDSSLVFKYENGTLIVRTHEIKIEKKDSIPFNYVVIKNKSLYCYATINDYEMLGIEEGQELSKEHLDLILKMHISLSPEYEYLNYSEYKLFVYKTIKQFYNEIHSNDTENDNFPEY